MLRCLHSIVACSVLTVGYASGRPGADPSVAQPVIPPRTTLNPLRLAPDQVLGQPEAIAIDDQDAVIVVERRPGTVIPSTDGRIPWLRDDLASTLPGHRQTVLEKWRAEFPALVPAAAPPRLRRLEDSDSDGVYEVTEISTASLKPPPAGNGAAVSSHGGSVYFGCSPGVWLLPPATDGEAAPAKSLVSGLGIRFATRDHGLRGFTQGPDGRLYGTIGDQGFLFTDETGAIHSLPDQGCAFRFEADGTGFEIVHRGLRNPCGVAFDAAGNAFTIDAGSGPDEPARLIYLVDDGDSGWRMEYQVMINWPKSVGLTKFSQPSWTAEQLWEMADRAGAAYVTPPVAHLNCRPTSITAHPGTGFLATEANRLLVCDRGPEPAMAGILSLAVMPDGAGMILEDSRRLVTGLNAADARFSWTGGLVIADAGARRIVTLDAGHDTWRTEAAAEAAKLARENLDSWESAKLTGLLNHPDLRIRIRAQLALTRKPGALAVFEAAVASTHPNERLHGIWGLGILARCGRGAPLAAADGFSALPDQKLQISASQRLVALLKDPDPEVRAQAVRAIGDAPDRFTKSPVPGKPPPRPGVGALIGAGELPLAALLSDPSPRVRYFAAISIGKLKVAGFYGSVCDFLAANDNRDPYLRHAGAYALQHLCTNPLMLTGLEQHPSAAVRMGAAIALRRMGTTAAAAFINDPDPTVADESIRAVTDLDLAENRLVVGYLLDNVASRRWAPFMLRRVVHNAYRMGTSLNAGRLLKLVGRPEIPDAIQLEVLDLCAAWAEPPPVNAVTGRWSPLPKRSPAEIKPVLAAELPRLMTTKQPVRDAVARLAAVYQLEPPAVGAKPETKPAPPAPPSE
ncbi:MAG: HEAT repeat domain-containing protein [Akkermansiaceae bacterium]|nr:HEAT repeat domain-containing protein [Akkermansiaceae bacterium]